MESMLEKTCFEILINDYSLIVFDERVTFWPQRIRSLPCACAYVALFAHRLPYNHYTQSHTHAMQQRHMHKAVTGRVEAKKLLSRRRQFEYSMWLNYLQRLRSPVYGRHSFLCDSLNCA